MALVAKAHKKSSIKMVLTFVSIIFVATPVNAFFRLLCFNPLGFGRIDPIVSPGQPSIHLHHLHGSGNLGIDSVNADYLLQSNCTSCSITVDKSGYWAPAMYFEHANGTFELMTTSGSITVYYKTEKRVNFLDQNYTAFPKNFRMVAGHSDRRNWVGPWPVPEQSIWTANDTTQAALSSKALGFNCLNYHVGPNEATFAFPYLRERSFIDAHCGDGLRAEVLFPSCWDGVSLDSPDHKSHVAYPTLLQDGACPKSHPVYLPILFYETIWDTQKFVGVPGQFVFSNGDPTGYGYHADFLAAWEDGVLERVMADPDCTDQDIFHRHNDGIQEHCPVFANSIQSQETAAQCKLALPEKLLEEKVAGPLFALPGNVKITGKRHDPGTEPEDFAPVLPLPSETDLVTEAPAKPSSPVVYSVSSTPVPSLNATVSAPANTASITSNLQPGTSVLSTSTFVSDGVYYEIVIIQSIVTVIDTVTETSTTNTTGPVVIRRNHIHGHIHHDVDIV